ncbi:GNAT family N-acetyltransferase [uncultured Devosia sp.]|uniref:GNAT family N-acetyltransferase n=1 Tax=uncultured Devosia sp. TaxID=211434 RepID=UPI0035CBA9C3
MDQAKFGRFEAMAFAESPACSVLLAELDGRAIGYLVHYWGVWMDDMAPCLHIADLFVHPDAHRHGIGRALMNRATEIARASGAVHMFWTVWRENLGAQDFYKRLGAELFEEERLMKLAVRAR